METAMDGPGWRCLWPLECALGEGPVWDDRAGVLWFVDIDGRMVHRFDPETGARWSWQPPCRIGALALRAGGSGFVAGTEHGFAFVDPEANRFEPIADPEPHLPGNRFNDGKVDADGVFWAGTMDDAKRARTGALYRLDATLAWTVADSGYRITNGPTFSLDGRIVYHNDTIDRVTYAFDHADGQLSNRRIFKDWSGLPGNPDGLTTDAEGFLWQAVWGGSCVRRVSPAGEVVAELALPVSQVTCCTFGGAKLDRLFVTTARQTLSAERLTVEPLAGGLFEVFPSVRGVPAGVFGG